MKINQEGACGLLCLKLWCIHWFWQQTDMFIRDQYLFSGAEFFQGSEDPIFSETVTTEYDPNNERR